MLSNESQFFIDLSTVKGTHTKKFWMYANHGSLDKHGQSSRDFMQIRCDDDEFRTIKSDTFSGKDLTGSIISSYDNLLDLGPIPPGSVLAYLQTLVCGKNND